MLEKIENAEREINAKIKEVHKEWHDTYGVSPDHKMSSYDVVGLLKKMGVLKEEN